MMNFTFRNPTEILFGKGMITEIGSRVPRAGTVLLLYGGGSIKHNGVYEQVRAALKPRRVVEFGGIEPNPHYETCLKVVELVKKEKVSFILAVGGGSVLDASKFIAAATCFRGRDPWDILRTSGENVKAALPLGTVLTLPATGSEANSSSVISRATTNEKLFFTSGHVFPVFSVLDPTATFSLPKKYIRNGIVDAFVHVMEQYMTRPSDAPLQDRLSESVLQTLVEVGPVTLARPRQYEPRATFMWSATLALNTLLGSGVPQDWGTHMIGHELTAFYGIDHAESLAVVMTGLWRYKMKAKRAKIEQYGRRVWNTRGTEAAIKKTEDFFKSLGMPTRLSAYNIDAEEAADKISARFAERGSAFGEDGDINADAVFKILRKLK